MDLAAQLTEVDRLRALDFPARPVRTGAVESGPGFHLTDLAAGEDRQDADPADLHRAEDDFGAACQALVELLAGRWGDPETLDLLPYLVRRAEGGAVPAPLDRLCEIVPEVYGWQVGERWIGLGVGRGDRDGALPLQLLLAVGRRDLR